MKKKGFIVFALCLIFLFVASTAAYAGVGNGKSNSPSAKQECEEYENNKKAKKAKKPNKGVAVTGITLNKNSTTIAVGSWERLVATIEPADAKDRKIYWFSGNPLVACVNPSGKVTGLTPGTAVIYVATRDGFKTASCAITVRGSSESGESVSGVSLNKSSITLNIGASQRLIATVTPDDAENKAVTWSSNDTGVATVDRNGNVYAVKAGTAVITVRTAEGGETDTCVVYVRNRSTEIPVTSVSIIKNTTDIVLKEGESKRLNIQIMPDNATEQDVTFTTSNSNIVTVDRYGNITGVREGTATIRVTTVDNGKTDSCRVLVVSDDEWVSATGVRLNLVNTTLPAGFNDRLRYTVEPSDASDREVRWTSSKPDVAAVNALGEIEAKKTGTTVITAYTLDGSETDSCTVVVVPAVETPARGILLNKVASTMVEGEMDYPEVIFFPADEDDYSLTWTSSDSDVATVSRNGRVTAIDPGTAVITVRASNYRSVSYTVTVISD